MKLICDVMIYKILYLKMFESVKSFFGNVKSFFGNAYDYFSDKVHAVGSYVASGTKSILESPASIVKTVYSDAKTLVGGLNNDFNKVLDRGSHTLDNIVDQSATVMQSGQKVIGSTFSSVGESLSMPLVIGAGLFGFLMLSKK